MTEEVLIAGFGGQGILLMGKILAQAALRAGYETTWFPAYGPEMRGGAANCTVVFSDEEIGSPIASSYSSAIVMNQPSLEKFVSKVRRGGRIFINASMVPLVPVRTDIEVHRVSAVEIATGLGKAAAANVVLLGAYLGTLGVLPIQSMREVIQEGFEDKGEGVVHLNLQALDAGVATARPAGTLEREIAGMTAGA